MFNRHIIITFLVLNLSACSAPGVKPEDANLLEAAVNVSSGEFDNQLSRKKFELKESQDLLNEEASKNQVLTNELQTLTTEKESLDTQVSILRVENNRLVQKSNNTKAATSAAQKQRAEQLTKIKILNSSITKLKRRKASELDNQEYKTQVLSLQQEIDVLRKMISNQ